MTSELATAPPYDLRDALMPAVPTIVEAAITAIAEREPGAGVPRGLERNLRLGLTDAVDRWFDGAPSAELDLHFSLGRAQARAGRSLDELMAFYRIAAQTMWRRLTELGAAHGIAPADLYMLAETGFGCVEEISTQAAAGFAEEQSHRSGTARSRRSELARLLLASPQPDAAALAAAASAVGVKLTPTLAMFVGDAGRYDAFARAAHDQILLGPRGEEFVGLLLDPAGPGRRDALLDGAERARARIALGPEVALAQARVSLARARALLSLARAGHVEGTALLLCEEHDVELLLSRDASLAAAVCARVLAPLEQVAGEAARAKLERTLRAWLEHAGRRKTIAHELGVHPQTVRYRMLRLRELFGAALEDPARRFELELALRARRYAHATVPGGDDGADSRWPAPRRGYSNGVV